jgi:hypothetical protein
MNFQEKRREPRLPLDSVRLPFLGSREEDQVCFEYLPLDVSAHGFGIAIPRWLVNRERLQAGDLINLNVPFQLESKTFHQGQVVWTRWDEALQAQVSGLSLQKDMPPNYPLYFSLENSRVITSQDVSLEDLLLRVLKDSVLLKKGISIYFNHLIPYFSRITGYPSKDYPNLKDIFLNDIKNKIIQHKEKLDELYQLFKNSSNHKTIAWHLNLEDLRDLIESEIYIDVLNITFDSDTALQYLQAIKELENKLYYNYNNIVMIYIESLT